MKNTRTLLAWLVAGTAAIAVTPAHAGRTVDAIRSRGHLICGVNMGFVGFSAADASGRWAGLDVDVCRAIAAALLGDAEQVQYVPLAAPQRFAALQAGEVDVLSRNTTVTLARDASLGLSMTAITYYDGQAFMVPARSRIENARQLRSQTVCVHSGTSAEKNLVDYSRANGLNLKPVVFDRPEAAIGAYFAGRCAAFTTDASALASVRNLHTKDPAAHRVLPDLISKEPQGPLVRRGDDDWTAIVRWVVYGLQEAEEAGVTQANAEQLERSADPVVQRMLGIGDDTGKLLGLDRAWLARAIKATGNYGEILDRNVGPKSALGVSRGLNNLWSRGGIVYPLPIR